MRTLTLTCITALMVLVLAGPASAVAVPDVSLNNLNSAPWLSHHLGDPLMSLPSDTYQWDVTAVFSEAGHDDEFILTAGGTVLLDNDHIGQTANNVTLSETSFKDGGYTYSLFGSRHDLGNVFVYRVKLPFDAEGYLFNPGDLLLAFDDHAADVDYDDFVLRATRATPIPGALWLLGTGLVGLVGLRRKFA